MSVHNYSGYSVDKPTSRVMAPPGGRGSNIFGTYEEEKKAPVVAAAATTNGSTNGSTNGHTPTATTTTNVATPTTNNENKQTSPSAEAAAFKSKQIAGNDLFGTNIITNNANRKKRTGYNPITGESYDDEPVQQTNGTPTATVNGTTPTATNGTTTTATPTNPLTISTTATPTEPEKPVEKPIHTSVAIKQPPGGRSTKLW